MKWETYSTNLLPRSFTYQVKDIQTMRIEKNSTTIILILVMSWNLYNNTHRLIRPLCHITQYGMVSCKSGTNYVSPLSYSPSSFQEGALFILWRALWCEKSLFHLKRCLFWSYMKKHVENYNMRSQYCNECKAINIKILACTNLFSTINPCE